MKIIILILIFFSGLPMALTIEEIEPNQHTDLLRICGILTGVAMTLIVLYL